MSCQWNPKKKEIEKWLDKKIHEFTTQENRSPQVSKKRWLDRNMYTEIHKIFFTSFPFELYEWIMRLADSQGRCILDQPIVWTLELVHRLEALEDKITRAMDHWLNWIIAGFITEFAIETTMSYNKEERCFLKGPRGKYIKSLNTWIKTLLCEKQVMRIH